VALRWLLVFAILTTLVGLMTMYFENRIVDTGVGMFARLTPEAIAAGRREALINAGIGIAGTIIILSLRAWRQRLNRKIHG